MYKDRLRPAGAAQQPQQAAPRACSTVAAQPFAKGAAAWPQQQGAWKVRGRVRVHACTSWGRARMGRCVLP